MERRKFIKCTGTCCGSFVLTSIIGLSMLESCGIAGIKPINAKNENGMVNLSLTQFVDRKFKIIRVANHDFDLGVQKLEEENTFRVLVMLCPHAFQPVTHTGNGFICPMHGSRFAADGSVIKGPASESMPTLTYKINHEFLTIIL